MKRVLTAAVLLPIFVILVVVPNGWFFDTLVALAAVICVLEFEGIAKNTGASTLKVFASVLTLAILAEAIRPTLLNYDEIILLALFGLMFCGLFAGVDTKKGLATITAALFGALYIGGLSRYFILLHHQGNGLGSKLIFLLCGAVWVGDSAAYYVGKHLGRHPLAKRLSPNKTLEGALANLVGTTAVVAVAGATFLPRLRLVDVVVLGILFTVFGILGDLFESFFKRSAGIKDASTLLPGHGGMLDRLDSLFFNAPLLYYYIKVFLS